ncbi:MAG TPA: hypothetical protein VHL52_12225 [Acidimicrobiia bacterium]|nr:hypothetical protein [Acidimicrobiia bacterium]
MASVHIREIQNWLTARGETDALPGRGGMFIEIRFDVDGPLPEAIDEEYASRALTVDSPQGTVTITFDEAGQLRSLDIS